MEKNEDCPVCLCEINYNEIDIIELDCGHNYHKECIDTWLKERITCPCCRQRASINGINVQFILIVTYLFFYNFCAS